MKMLKWFRVSSVVSILLLVLAGCGNDTKTDTVTNTGSGAINHAPVIASLTANPATISVGGTTALTCLASDTDNDPLTYNWSANSGTFSGFSGSGTTISWTAPTTAGSYIVSCKATDGKLETVTQVSIGVQAPVPVPVNNAPTIASLTASPPTVSVGGTTALTCLASDTDNDPLTYTWSAISGAITGTGSTVTWTAPTTAGSYIVSCKATDGKLETVTQVSIGVQAPVPVPVNNAPTIASLTASPAEVVTNGTTSFSCIATDADNDQLTYAWSANSGTITGTGGTVSWIAPATTGTATITCKASDGEAEVSTQASVKVSEWIVPTKFAASINKCSKIHGTTYGGKLYLAWVTRDTGYCTGFDKAYLSVFDSTTADAIEVMRTEILNYDSLLAVAVDQNGIYISASFGGGSSVLLGLDFNAKQRWSVGFLEQGGVNIFSIAPKDGYIYIAGDVYGNVPSFINAGGTDVIVGKYDTTGNLYWLSQWGTTCLDRGWVVVVKDDGLDVSTEAGSMCGMLGTSSIPPPSYQGDVTLKYDLNGNFLGVTK